MKMIWRFLPLCLLTIFCWTGPLFADYKLVLKNGRSITVQRYREEGGKIIVYSLGGELAIAKDQIESIVRVGKEEGKVPPDAKESPGEAVGTRQEEKERLGSKRVSLPIFKRRLRPQRSCARREEPRRKRNTRKGSKN
jgi:hypothetical protein